MIDPKVKMTKEQKEKHLYNNSLIRLGEMLKLLKKGDLKENRENFQSHCKYLSDLGKKANLFGWVELLEVAGIAIVNNKNNYEYTAKLIIKEIKKAGENIITEKAQNIYVSNELYNLTPNYTLKQKDLETVIGENLEIEEQGTIANNLTVSQDLWVERPTDANLQPEKLKPSRQASSKNQETPDSEKVSANFRETNSQAQEDEPVESLDDWLDESELKLEDNLEIDNWEGRDNQKQEREDNDADLAGNFAIDLETEGSGSEQTDFAEDLFHLFEDFQHDVEKAKQVNIPDRRGTSSLKEELELESFLRDVESGPSESPFMPAQILVYENFDDLSSLIGTGNLLKQPVDYLQLDLMVGNYICYYDSFEELEKLINRANEKIELAQWQELVALLDGKGQGIEIQELAEAETSPPIPLHFSKGEPPIGPRGEELSDLDRLLAQAETAPKQQKWQKRARTIPGGVGTKKLFEQSMRVPVKQLDNLNNLIGEIVVRRNRLEEDQDRLRQFLDNLLNHVQKLSDLGARMQDLYERSLLEGALLASRERNQAAVKEQLSRGESPVGRESRVAATDLEGKISKSAELDVLELDRFTGFHLLSQDIIESIVRVRESTSDIQFLVDETEQLGRNLRQITTQLQEEINKSRMVPFSQNAERLPRPIRDMSQEYNKQVQLKVEGREVLIDKMILEHLWDPLLQLVKNAVTHGIESPEERVMMGKPPTGTITIRAFLQGPQTVISVSDDGAGIDPHKIKQKAIQTQIITPAQAYSISTKELYELLFYAGFSTKDQADSHAGRGVGLDIVRSKLNEIRGSVAIDSTPGYGTTFSIRLPLTLSIGKALCCLNDNARIAFPLDGIEDSKDYSAGEIKINAQGQKCIPWHNTLLPFRPLSSLLNYNRQITRSIVYGDSSDREQISIVILRGGNNLLAVQVDQVIGQEEIVIKQISGPIPKPKGIAGATVRSDGIVMPIGDVIELIEIAQGNIGMDFKGEMFVAAKDTDKTTIPAAGSTQPLVLIVDDSITVREMLSITFTKSGYRVEQARDGQEAWQKLRSGLPCNLVFCDIEMPRMNGLELLQQMQADEKLAEIPMAILSSRGAEKHQKIAAELGASAYLIKPYVEKDLIDTAARMIQGEVLLPNSTKLEKSKTTSPALAGKVTSYGREKQKEAQLVLIVDDSVVVREMLSMTFKKAGFRVEQARDGQDAWEKIAGGLPCDIILCDIEMPRMNGLEFLAKMQQDEKLSRIPVAMVTSRGAEKHRKIAADLGAKAYFTKPYLEDELLEATHRLIKGEVLLSKR